MAVSTSVEIFCSCAHVDEVWLRKLETHLSLLKQWNVLNVVQCERFILKEGTMKFPSHPKCLTTSPRHDVRWIRHVTTWVLSEKKR